MWLDLLSLTSLIILKEVSIWGAVNIDNATFTALERQGYWFDFNNELHQTSRRSPTITTKRSLSI